MAQKNVEENKADKKSNLSRNIKVVSVSPIVLQDWLKQDSVVMYKVVEDGLPADVKLEGVRYDPFRGMVDFLYSSKEFEEVDNGEIPPQLNPVLKSLAKAKK